MVLSLLQPVNESHQSVMLRMKRSVRPRWRNRERDSFAHTCESINKLTALLSCLFVSLSFASSCLSACLPACPSLKACPPPSTSPSLQHTHHWRLHFSPFKSLPNWHFVGRGKASPECTPLTIPRHVHMNASLHKDTWISLLTFSPPALWFTRRQFSSGEQQHLNNIALKHYCLKSKRSLSGGIQRTPVKPLVTEEQGASHWCSTACRTAIASITEEGQVLDYLSPSSFPSSAPLLPLPPSSLLSKTHRCEGQTWLTMRRLPPSRNTRNCSARGRMRRWGHTLCFAFSTK